MNKRQLVEQIVTKLEQEASAIYLAAKTAHEAATHEESRAEDSHDTRGIEASYLAGAQANRAAELKAQIAIFRQLSLRDFKSDEAIAPGALVELQTGTKTVVVFLVAQSGGITLQFEGASVQVLTPLTPLGEAILGHRAGESIDVELQRQSREYLIKSLS